MQIEVKNLKSFKGHEGEPCLQGSLYINGKPRGDVSDDSHGGPMHFSDHKAYEEITEYAKGFPSEFDFEHAEILVGVIMSRMDAKKKLDRYFAESLCYVNTDGVLALTKKIKGDVEATKARWMADPKTKATLKAKRFITDRNELYELYFEQNDDLQHPALVVKSATKKATVEENAEKLAAYFKEEDEANRAHDKKVVKEKKFSAEKSKLELCRDVYTDAANANKARGEMIKLFISVAGCTPAGASTYYQKLKSE